MKHAFQYLTRSSIAIVAVTLFHPTDAQAQWSADPTSNLIVSDLSGGSTQPKMVPTPDGGFYVSWFSGADGFDIYLQRLDASGNELWPHNGVLVADRSYGFTYDYGLTVDAAGNAFVSFNCCENNSAAEHIAVSKITSDGALAWGPTGIAVSSAAEAVYNAYVTPSGDGNVVAAWGADSGVRLQKLDADGNALWVAGGVVLTQPPSALKLLGGLQPAEDGNVIASWSNQAGSARILYAQKLAAADGATLWGNGVRVFGEGNLQAGYYPPFVTDGAGGGVFWDYDVIGSAMHARVQRIDAAGNRMLGVNGVVATTDTTNRHTSTQASFDPASGDIYVVWRDGSNNASGQSFDGVSAQRIDAAGNRAWGNTGKVLVPLTDSTDSLQAISQLVALPSADGFLASWVTGAIPAPDQPITVAHLDAAGEYVWPTQTVQVKNTRATGRTIGAISSSGFAAYAWVDGSDGDDGSTIRAQNLNFDGTLGIPAVVNHSVGGTVSGLVGSGFLLQLNGGDDLAITADGGFTFPMAIADGSSYAVSVLTQPSDPAQECTIANGDGTIDGADVTDIAVTCVASESDTIFANGFEAI